MKACKKILSVLSLMLFMITSSGYLHAQTVQACITVTGGVNKSITVCKGTVVNLVGNNCIAYTNVKYSWRNISYPTFPEMAVKNYPALDSGRWVLTVTDNANTALVSRDTFHVKHFPQVTFAILNDPDFDIKCQNSTYLMNATQGAGITDYKWYANSVGGTPLGTTSQLTVTTVPGSAAAYIVNAKDANNCTLSDTMELYELPSPPVNLGPDRQICQGETVSLQSSNTTGGIFSYTWSTGASTSSITTGASGTYWLRVLDHNWGCSSTDTIKVLATPKPVISVTGTPAEICFGGSAQLNTTFTSAGTPPYQYTWTPASTLSSTTIANPVASPTETTTYKVVVRDAGGSTGCRDSVNIQVKVNPKVVAGVSFSDSTICNEGSVVLGAVVSGGTPGYSYLWKPAATLSDATLSNPIATPTSATKYTVVVTDTKGCKDSSATNISTSSFEVNISQGSNASICTGDSILLNTVVNGGVPGFTYTWSPALQMTSSTSASAYAKPIASGTVFKVDVKDSKGCEFSDEITLNLHPLPVADAGINDTICFGSSANISGILTVPTTGPYIYKWTNSLDNNVLTGISHTVNHNATVNYHLQITDGQSCKSAVDTKRIVVRPAPVVGLTDKDTSQCTGLTMQLNAGHPSNSGFNFSWKDQNNTDLGSSTSIVVNQQGLYTVTMAEPVNGCETTVVKRVNFIETPTSVVISSSGKVEVEESLELTAVASGLEIVYQWTSSGNGSFEGTGEQVFYLPELSDTGNVEIMVVAENICGMVDTVHIITVYQKPKAANDQIVYVPTAFLPGSSNIENATLRVFAPAIAESNFTFEVFNRWGELIYRTESYSEASQIGWSGQNHSMGVYTYIIKGEYLNGEKFARTGNATLIR